MAPINIHLAPEGPGMCVFFLVMCTLMGTTYFAQAGIFENDDFFFWDPRWEMLGTLQDMMCHSTFLWVWGASQSFHAQLE